MEVRRTPYRFSRKDLSFLLLAGALMVVWNIFCWKFPFFWDNILNSKIAHWYLDTGFSQLTVPENMDAGHPPFFSMYLAFVWRVTGGPSLWVAHLAMLPFLLLLLWQYYKLACRLLPESLRLWALAFLVCEPTFLAQSSMLTPDIALVSLFLLCLNALLDGRRGWLAVALVLMASVTFRGILAVPAVFLADVGLAWLAGQRKPNWLAIWPYLPVAGLTLLWLIVHYQAVGWLLTPPPETYGAHRELIGVGGTLRNFGIVGWRFLDFGRVAMWVFVLLAGIGVWRRGGLDGKLRRSGLLFLAPTVFFTLLFIPFSNPIGMRYFMVSYLLLGLIGAGLLLNFAGKQRWLIGGAICLVMASGHFWVYPDPIAKSWDGSLAHLPYFELRHQMSVTLQNRRYSQRKCCSDFPMLANSMHTEITNGGDFLISDKNENRGLLSCDLVLYSNVSNGFSEEEMADLNNPLLYEVVHDWKSGGVKMRLYEKITPAP